MKTGTSLGTFLGAVVSNMQAYCLMLRLAALQNAVKDKPGTGIAAHSHIVHIICLMLLSVACRM